MPFSSQNAKILLIEDNEFHAELIMEILEERYSKNITWVDNSSEGLKEIAKKVYQCILLDYSMPGMNGLQLLLEAKHYNPDVPVIIFTGMGSEELAAQAIKMGAYDYLPKGENLISSEKLTHSVAKAIENYYLREALKKTETKYRAILQGSPLPIIEYGVEGDLIIKESDKSDLAAAELKSNEAETEDALSTLISGDYTTRLFYERNLLNTIISTSHVFLAVFDMKGNTIVWNKMAEAISGYTQEEINTADKVFQHLYPDYSYRFKILLKQHKKLTGRDRDHNYESSIVTKRGETKTISWTISTVSDHRGEIAFIINAGIDETKSKIIAEEREKALHELKERVNEISSLYNLSKSMEESKSLVEFMNDTISNITQAMRSPSKAQIKISVMDKSFNSPKFKSTSNYLVMPLTSEGNEVGSISVYYPKTHKFSQEEQKLVKNIAETVSRYIENRELGQKVLESEKYLESIFNATGDIITVLDLDCNIMTHNQALLKLTGKSFVGRKCYEALNGDKSICKNCIVKSAQSSGRMLEGEVYLEDQRKWYHREAHPYIDQEGNIRSIIAVTHDITAWKTMQEELRRIDKLASIGQLAAGIAHEIKNPLTGISSMTQILKEKSEEKSEDYQILDDILEGINRIDDIVQKSLDYARPKNLNFAPGKIIDSVNSALKLLGRRASRRNVRISRDIPHDLPIIYLDKDQIEIMFFNLINNAIDAMPEGGHINISIGVQPPIPEWNQSGNKSSKKAANTKYLYISIADQGIGIHVDEWQKVFEPFYTRKSSGTGLGLSITHTIVEEHKGDIVLRSTVGKGTTFYIRLPVRTKSEFN